MPDPDSPATSFRCRPESIAHCGFWIPAEAGAGAGRYRDDDKSVSQAFRLT